MAGIVFATLAAGVLFVVVLVATVAEEPGALVGLIAAAPFALGAALLLPAAVTVIVGSDALTVRSFPFRARRIRFDEIVEIRVDPKSWPMAPRIGIVARGPGYTTFFLGHGPAVVVTTQDHYVAFQTGDPDATAAAIEDARSFALEHPEAH
ncbi:hypothetical protein BIU97_08285 [Curtobacterium sp. MCBA15_009]|uniref:PH domain-containing protein n=1 Tax=Curtobacterium sp. MCBA15_009 TaxID=1898737 RepID=UPI0008DD74F8|nr:PH domain-containing protein [Curtobacterium sp. MCBA15_009]OII10876.1 hypothetical protein BIU97_08285 [Curtobacterium sp. MCBA15_009]